MTKNSKLAITAAMALILSFAIMVLLHNYGSQSSSMLQFVANGRHPMAAMWHEMGWMMALGPIAMFLFFGGILTFIVLFIQFLFKEQRN
ncbi:MAG: hypothetical protein WBA83_04955 [Burkholderiaceae bacterium]